MKELNLLGEVPDEWRDGAVCAGLLWECVDLTVLCELTGEATLV